jgi:pimeloyl-ACP methyl ester carboxylesterase
VRRVAIFLALSVWCRAPAAAAPAPGWRSFPIGATGEYAERYVPASHDPGRPAPLVVFLHGYATLPSHYRALVEAGAEATGAVVVMPRADGLGWGAEKDPLTIGESVRLVGEELALDARRTAIAGHSAGGAYAYLLAYGTVSGFSAVFTLSSPFYAVPSVADPLYKAPIRMYYGDGDPNYHTAYPRLVEQWQQLGVPFEAQVEPGYPHCCWPDSALVAGFQFLVARSYPAPGGACAPAAMRLCLHDGRFAVEVDWHTTQASGEGQAVAAASESAGLFWFFASDNWEMLVKVLDGCALNGQRWVFAAATTDVGFTLTVTDTATGEVWSHENPLGQPAAPVQDTAALGCP